MFVYRLQHVMSRYAGVVAVPLIVGGAMGLEFRELAYLLTAALLVSGLATPLQTSGAWADRRRRQGGSWAACHLRRRRLEN
jgi:uric acid transporter